MMRLRERDCAWTFIRIFVCTTTCIWLITPFVVVKVQAFVLGLAYSRDTMYWVGNWCALVLSAIYNYFFFRIFVQQLFADVTAGKGATEQPRGGEWVGDEAAQETGSKGTRQDAL